MRPRGTVFDEHIEEIRKYTELGIAPKSIYPLILPKLDKKVSATALWRFCVTRGLWKPKSKKK